MTELSTEGSPSDNQDANKLIIESVPLAGMTRRLIDPHQATQIRAKIALALGMEDDELAKKLAHFQRNGYPLDAYEQVRKYDIPIATCEEIKEAEPQQS